MNEHAAADSPGVRGGVPVLTGLIVHRFGVVVEEIEAGSGQAAADDAGIETGIDDGDGDLVGPAEVPGLGAADLLVMPLQVEVDDAFVLFCLVCHW